MAGIAGCERKKRRIYPFPDVEEFTKKDIRAQAKSAKNRNLLKTIVYSENRIEITCIAL